MVLSLIYNHLNVILQARLLQDETTNNVDNKEVTTSDTNSSLTQTQIIRDTCIVYGSIFAFLFVLFLILRPYYPSVYNIKKCYPKLQLLHRDNAAAADKSNISDNNKHGEREEKENNDKHQIAAVDENEYHTVDNDGSMHSTNYITPSSTLPDASPALSQSLLKTT